MDSLAIGVGLTEATIPVMEHVRNDVQYGIALTRFLFSAKLFCRSVRTFSCCLLYQTQNNYNLQNSRSDDIGPEPFLLRFTGFTYVLATCPVNTDQYLVLYNSALDQNLFLH